MAACVWTMNCSATGATATLSFDVSTSTWTFTRGGSTYTYVQTGSDSQFCNSITVTKSSGSSGPDSVVLNGLKILTIEQPNCCIQAGVPQQPTGDIDWTSATITVSNQTGIASCLPNGPFTSAGSSGEPTVATWAVGSSPFGPCEGSDTFYIDEVGGCIIPGMTGHPDVVTIVSYDPPGSVPWGMVVSVDLTNIIGTGAGSATFTINVPSV